MLPPELPPESEAALPSYAHQIEIRKRWQWQPLSPVCGSSHILLRFVSAHSHSWPCMHNTGWDLKLPFPFPTQVPRPDNPGDSTQKQTDGTEAAPMVAAAYVIQPSAHGV